MRKTGMTLNLENEQWGTLNDGTETLTCTTKFGQREVKLFRTRNVLDTSNPRAILTDLVSGYIFGWKYAKVLEMGENYALVEEIWYEGYSETYISKQTLVVVDPLSLRGYSAKIN